MSNGCAMPYSCTVVWTAFDRGFRCEQPEVEALRQAKRWNRIKSPNSEVFVRWPQENTGLTPIVMLVRGKSTSLPARKGTRMLTINELP